MSAEKPTSPKPYPQGPYCPFCRHYGGCPHETCPCPGAKKPQEAAILSRAGAFKDASPPPPTKLAYHRPLDKNSAHSRLLPVLAEASLSPPLGSTCEYCQADIGFKPRGKGKWTCYDEHGPWHHMRCNRTRPT